MEKQTFKKGRRAMNFTYSETDVLITEVAKRRQILFGPLRGPSLTQFHRDRAWERVLHCVNAVAPTLRTVTDLKKKFKDLKSRVKAKANVFKEEVKKTGGAYEVPPFNALEKKILTFVETESSEGVSSRNNLPQNYVEEQSCFISPPELPPEIGLSPESVHLQFSSESQSSELPPERGLTPESVHVKIESQSPLPSPLETSTSSELLGQLVEEFRGFREQFGQFLELKKRKLDLMEVNANCKKEPT